MEESSKKTTETTGADGLLPLTPPKPPPARPGTTKINLTGEDAGGSGKDAGGSSEDAGGSGKDAGGSGEDAGGSNNAGGSGEKAGGSGEKAGEKAGGSAEDASNLPKENKKSKKRTISEAAGDDDETPKQPKKRQKMIKHRPKIYDSSLPPKVPKPKVEKRTPKPRTPRAVPRKRNPVEKKKGVKKSLNFDEEDEEEDKLDLSDNDNGVSSSSPNLEQDMTNLVDIPVQIENNIIEVPLDKEKEEAKGPKLNLNRYGVVYRRKGYACPKKSIEAGPNFPSILKKTRMARRKAAIFDKLGVLTSSMKKKKRGLLNLQKLRLLLPTQKQRSAAITDPISFLCVLNLDPLVKDRKKRSSLSRLSSKVSFVRRNRTNTPRVRRKNFLVFSHLFSEISENSKKQDCEEDTVILPDLNLTEVPIDEVPIELSDYTEDEQFHSATSLENAERKGKNKIDLNLCDRPEICDSCLTPKIPEPKVEAPPKRKYVKKGDKMKEVSDTVVSTPNSNVPRKSRGQKKNVEESLESNPELFDALLMEDGDTKLFDALLMKDADPIFGGNTAMDYLIYSVTKKIEFLRIEEERQLVVQRNQNALVPRKHKKKTRRQKALIPHVNIDQVTDKKFDIWMGNVDVSEDEEETDEEKKKNEKYWENEKMTLKRRIDSFISKMHLLQGDRRFSKWNGSVVDAVVGVFLTQNVTDVLSSSACMSLAARFPVKNRIVHCNCCEGYSRENSLEEAQKIGNHSHVPMEMNQLCDSIRIEELIRDYYTSYTEETEVDNNIPSSSSSQKNRKKRKAKVKEDVNWDAVRVKYIQPRERNRHNADSVDWEAVRVAPVEEIAEAIKKRGQHNILAEKIKKFLNRIYEQHGSIDLEWLRDVPPDTAKDYLLSIHGIGLKSVECLRLLTLHHHAFPVDTNIGRILVRLGWVPLHPLPGDLHLHLLNQYPMVDEVQRYIWPRLAHLDPLVLYELHYQLITMGKVLCQKRTPNCNECPMKGECQHFASAFTSSSNYITQGKGEDRNTEREFNSNHSEPIVELPPSPVHHLAIEEPASPFEIDIEDFGSENEIPAIRLHLTNNFFIQGETEESNKNEILTENVYNFEGESEEVGSLSVILNPRVNSLPAPKLKELKGLRTIHQVFELPDHHPLLNGIFEKRDRDDKSSYTLAIWGNEAADGSLKFDNETVLGTILIPCRTANRGSFPLNGTYFQVNEVFADEETSQRPITVSRKLIWNLKKRPLYCGKVVSSIFKALRYEVIQDCFWKGFICVRGFNRTTRTPTELHKRFHDSTGVVDEDEE